MRRKKRRLLELTVHAAVVCVFLLAQALAFGHQLDLDAHSKGEPCKICVSIAGLGGAAVGKAERPVPRCVCTLAASAADSFIVESSASASPPVRGPPR